MAPSLLDQFFLILGAITFLAIILYLLYGGLHRTFSRVGFTPGEATLILAGTFIGAFIPIPLFEVGDWVLAISVGGAVVPLVVTYVILRRHPALVLEVLAGTAIVSAVTYLVTTPTEQGIVSPFPLYLLPPFAAAGLAFLAFWREEGDSAPLAYMIGTLGAIIGADVFRLGEFLSQPPPEPGTMAVIGGAAVLDMVYLTGVIAVALDAFFFSHLQKARDPAPLPYEEHLVFTASTPSETIRDYTPDLKGTVQPRAPEARGRSLMDRVREATEEAERRARAGSGQTSGGPEAARGGRGDAEQRLARHQDWEARLRERR